jgi:Flp pilus assembly protein TadB
LGLVSQGPVPYQVIESGLAAGIQVLEAVLHRAQQHAQRQLLDLHARTRTKGQGQQQQRQLVFAVVVVVVMVMVVVIIIIIVIIVILVTVTTITTTILRRSVAPRRAKIKVSD